MRRPSTATNGAQPVEKRAVICDLDGVLHRGSRILPGALKFWRRLRDSGRPYLFLTNSPEETPRQLHLHLKEFGFDIPEHCFYTSAEATASFVASQQKHARVFMIGTEALRKELERCGMRLTERSPDYVVFGSGGRYDAEVLEAAVEHVAKGARLIATNPEPVALTDYGTKPGTGALVAPIQIVTNVKPFFVGKPNHLMIQAALQRLGRRPEEAYTIGDKMETDVLLGLQTGLKTILVLQGDEDRKQIEKFSYKPDYIYRNAGQIPLDRLP